MADYLVCYDIDTVSSGGERRLRQVAKTCEGFGVRVQQSVFECVLGEPDRLRLVARLRGIIDDTRDNVRIYPLVGDARLRVVSLGRTRHVDTRDPLIF